MKRRASNAALGNSAKRPRKKTYKPTTTNLVVQRNLNSKPEKKNIDADYTIVSGISTNIASPAWSIPGATNLVNGCAQGATETTRIGRKILMTKVDLIWTAAMGAA